MHPWMDLVAFLAKTSVGQQRVSSHQSDDTKVLESSLTVGTGAGGQGGRGGDIGCNNVALNHNGNGNVG